MRGRHTRSRDQREAFTLLELLMVVIIIAILASIALPQYIKATEKARAAEALNILGAIRASELRYKAQHATGNYTVNVNELDVDVPPAFQSWTLPANSGITVANGNTGFVVANRSGGTYSGNQIGIEFGLGTVCGNFVPAGLSANCNAN